VKTHRFTVLGRLSGANEAILKARANKYASAGIKRSETKRCAMAALLARIPSIKTPIRVHFHWVEPNMRRDLDNIRYAAKYILDGLQVMGALPDDGWRWVVSMSDSFALDKFNPRVEVTLEEYDGFVIGTPT
jgi:Holliday junction resolvase RusA-like endonuclease